MPWLDLSWWTIFRRCVSIGAAVSLWLCARLERRSLRSYGLADPRAGKRDLLFGLLLGIGMLGLMLVVGLVSGACRIDVTPDRLKLWRTVIGFLPAAALVGVLEELVFRGVILQHLLVFSKPVAVVASSALYAVVHLKTATLTLATWLELGGLFLLGSVLALSYLVTHQLYLAIGLHGVLAYGARINKLVIDIPETSLSWLVGTSRLVNGLVGWLVLLGIGGVIVRWARSSQRGGAPYGNP
jgi:membrane protease YdiL (CAAX protease family)